MNIQEQSWPSFLSRVVRRTGTLIIKLFRILIIFQLIIGLSASGKPYVLLISFDGFRADYLEWYFTPNFDRLASKGVKAQGLKPVFVTKTFPNHYSIVTGMYIETHGLIGNDFYARDLDLHFRLSDRSMVENGRFYGGEPIWVTAENQGLKTAAYFWVGSEAPVGGIFPSIWKPYDESIPFRARIDSIATWFELPSDRRPNLALLYFNEPDNVGHNYGPKAPETEAMIEQLDEIMGTIMDKMELLSIYDSLNIIVVADHGMAEVDPAKMIKLYRYFNFSGLKIEGTNPYVFLSGVSPRRLNKIYKTLSR
ncbi:MAG: ectonucleotide pyrophosphatase/phosphodiesterase, partial [Candidatus Neomarinimicrobiota bacterium]